jgi:hypothetical protein
MIHGCVGMARRLNQADRQIAEAATWISAEFARVKARRGFSDSRFH